MNYLMKKAVNLNGQDMMLAPLDIDFAHRTISLTGEIDEDVATVMNSALRCLARDSEDDITIYIQSPGGSVSAGFSIYDTVKALRIFCFLIPPEYTRMNIATTSLLTTTLPFRTICTTHKDLNVMLKNTVMRPSLITTSRFVHTWRVIKKALFERFASWVII